MVIPRKNPLAAFRKSNNEMSQADAAALVGITQEMWSRLERGTAYASPKVAKRIAELTGCALESLLNFGDNENGPSEAVAEDQPIGLSKDMP